MSSSSSFSSGTHVCAPSSSSSSLSSTHQPLPPSPLFPTGYPDHLAIKPRPPDWLCVYCRCACRSPVQPFCGPHLACYSCFVQEVAKAAGGPMFSPSTNNSSHTPPLTTAPMLSTALQIKIAKYEIKCPRGCEAKGINIGKGDYDEDGIATHLAVCLNELVECRWGCGLKQPRRIKWKHELECNERRCSCYRCGKEYPWKEYEQHQAEPPHCALSIYCPNNCFTKNYDFLDGEEVTDPFTHMSLDDTDPTVILRSEEQQHLQLCPLSSHSCFVCHDSILNHAMNQHLQGNVSSHFRSMAETIAKQSKELKRLEEEVEELRNEQLKLCSVVEHWAAIVSSVKQRENHTGVVDFKDGLPKVRFLTGISTTIHRQHQH